MNQPLDVALRVRMLYEAGGNARAAVTDMEKVERGARQLAGVRAGDGLGRDLREVSTGAQLAGRELAVVGQTAARFGAVSTVSLLSRDLKAAAVPAQALRRELIEVGGAAEKLGRGHGVVALERDLASATRRAEDLERRLEGVGRRAGRGHGQHGGTTAFVNEALSTTGLGGGARLGMGVAAAGGLAAGAGIAATGAAIAGATRQAISFEHAMTEVKKAVNDTPEGIAALERDILRLSRVSGVAKTEIAGLVAQAGYNNVPRDQMPGFAEIATKSAVAFRMSGDAAGEALGKLRNAYGITNNAQLKAAGDAINVLGDNVGTSERNILNVLNRVSGVAQTYRIPIAKAGAVNGAVMGLGVEPDVASTSYNSIINRLGTSDHQSADFQRGLRGLNLNSRRTKAMMQQDATGGLIEVLERINKLPEAKKPGVIADLAGEEHGPALARMAASLGKIHEALALVQRPEDYSGSLEKTFRVFSSDTQAQIRRAEAALDSYATKMGARFSPAVRVAAAAVERWLSGMVKAMELGDRVGAIGEKMAKGVPLTPAERKEVDADPELKERAERRSRELMQRELPNAEEGDRGALELRTRQGTLREMEERIKRNGARGLDTGDLERQLGAARERFNELYPHEGRDLPGTGKRSDLEGGLKASLASYNAELDRGLDRAERRVREATRQMREDLAIGAKVELTALRYGGDGGARIQAAALGGGGLGGGLSSGGGGGSRGMPGRFGGSIPLPGGGGAGRGHGGGGSQPDPGRGGATPPGTAQGRENVGSWLAFAQRSVDEGGLGFTKEQAHGLVAGLQGESGRDLDPGAWNGNDRGKPAGGTAQWRDDRLRNLQAFAQERGKNWRDRGTQQEFLRHEMLGKGAHGGGSERRAYDAIRGAQTRGEALGATVQRYERPQFPDAEIRKRSQYLRGHDGEAQAEDGPRPGRGHPGENGQFDPLGGAARRYSSGYGMRDHPVLGGRRMHHGQDMAAPAGTPVSAMQGGRVTAVSRMGDVTVTHPDGSTKTYRHIDPSGVRVGQDVEGGAQIGSLRARDPRSTGPHLHLEATDPQGRRYDPRPEISAAGRQDRTLAMRPRRELPEARSPRFMDPSSYSLKPGVAAETMGTGSGGRFGLNGPVPVQNFHGGFDAAEVARRAQLESNRSIQRGQARALHDGVMPA